MIWFGLSLALVGVCCQGKEHHGSQQGEEVCKCDWTAGGQFLFLHNINLKPIRRRIFRARLELWTT